MTVTQDTLGLGKMAEYEEMCTDATRDRKKLEIELEETPELAAKRLVGCGPLFGHVAALCLCPCTGSPVQEVKEHIEAVREEVASMNRVTAHTHTHTPCALTTLFHCGRPAILLRSLRQAVQDHDGIPKPP